MSAKSKIEWTDATWSPLRVRVKPDAAAIAEAKGYASLIQIAGKMAGHVGPHCERVSHGCDNCYSDTNNHRCLPANGTGLPFDRRSRDMVEPFLDENILQQPLQWRTPRRIFVENQSDLFGDWVTDEAIDRVFTMMALCVRHTFQVLTKRPERMRLYCERHASAMAETRANECPSLHGAFPDALRNVWLGVSVEDQRTADERIPLLLQTPATVRFVSYEPALGPVDLIKLMPLSRSFPWLDWVIAGGESGPGARPSHPQWLRDVRDQCQAAGVPFFFKQWGEFSQESRTLPGAEFPKSSQLVSLSGVRRESVDIRGLAASDVWIHRIGKTSAGRLLDGREHNEFPRAPSC
jgi:protein gp37